MPDKQSIEVTGCVRAHRVADGVYTPAGPWQPNMRMYDWASIVAHLTAYADPRYRVAGMYIEYQNMSDPGDTADAPSYTRADGISYYNSLATSADRDYLRVPLTSSLVESGDEQLYPGGNIIRFFAQTQGTQGVHGKPFGAANNSKVFGGALVAFPDVNDATRDLVFSRFYYAPENQQLYLANSQIGLEWAVTLQ